MQIWRWDQGRLEYFSFNNIRNMAKCLVELDGVQINAPGIDPLRHPLQVATGLPFSPSNYRVWRNYGRVFECCFLATDIAGILAVTDLCRKVATTGSSAVNIDEYLSVLIPRFYFSFPAFQEYDISDIQIFPFCAVMKFLLAAMLEAGEASVSLEEVFSFIIGNDCLGTEPVESYQSLSQSGRTPAGNEKRQVREMLIFVSQSSFLKWHRNRLYLDILPGDTESIEAFRQMLTPVVQSRNGNQAREILHLGEIAEREIGVSANTTRRQPADVVFTEGRRVRVTHLRMERSPRLRRWFFSSIEQPYLCNMCGRDIRLVYPWTDNILEIHHLLPLSSAIMITTAGTSLSDIVALCPNCHTSVHIYYKKWLNDHSADDFLTKTEANDTYQEAKGQIRI
jgi:5-methylcytosine-specific restriction endonuclease McrA